MKTIFILFLIAGIVFSFCDEHVDGKCGQSSDKNCQYFRPLNITHCLDCGKNLSNTCGGNSTLCKDFTVDSKNATMCYKTDSSSSFLIAIAKVTLLLTVLI